MKKSFISLMAIAIIAFITSGIQGCQEAANNQNEETPTEQENNEVEEVTTSANAETSDEVVAYQCPMKCEGDKTYPEAGSCPTCNMDLEVLADAHDHEAHDHDHDHDGHDHDHEH